MGNSNSAPPVEDVDKIKNDTKLPVQKIKTLWYRFNDLDKHKRGKRLNSRKRNV
jgi:hypothetical protein